MSAQRGQLVREIPVRLLNVSSSGFLLEAHRDIAVGATGTLDVDLGSYRYLNQVHLSRSVQLLGASQTFRVGGKFSHSEPESLKNTAQLHRRPTDQPRRPTTAHTPARHVEAA